MSLQSSNLFKPIQVGQAKLSHRAVVAPLTRMRAAEDHTPTDIMLTHYDDVSKTPGSLVIVEGTFVHKIAGGYPNVPGIYNEKHAKAWRKITDKVHENGSYVSIQLWNLGRAAMPDVLVKEGIKFQSSSGHYMDKASEEAAKKAGISINALTKDDIKEYVKIYADSAERAVKQAGFDFVEIHGAHGYLLDEFFSAAANTRTDEYGGTIENRSRFFFEIVDAVIARIGGDKVACRTSPWAKFQGMAGIDGDPSPYAQFGYIYSELEKRRKNKGFAYLSVVEPRTNCNVSFDEDEVEGSNEFVFDIFKGNVIRAGDYIKRDNPKDAGLIINDVSKNDRTLIAFGRWTTSNTDLVEKLRNGWDMTKYDRPTFYTPGNWGYNTWLRHGEVKTFDEEAEKKRIGVPLA